MTTYNYTPRLIKNLKKAHSGFVQYTKLQDTASILKRHIAALERCTKFMIPEKDIALCDSSISIDVETYMENFRLPFPEVAIEFNSRLQDEDPDTNIIETLTVKSVLLAREVDEAYDHKTQTFQSISHFSGKLEEIGEYTGKCIEVTLFQSDEEGNFYAPLMFTTVPLFTPDENHTLINLSGEAARFSKYKKGFKVTQFPTPYGTLYDLAGAKMATENNLTFEQTFSEIVKNNIEYPLTILINFCLLINCANIKQTTITPSRNSLKKARSIGYKSLPEYKVLDLVVPKEEELVKLSHEIPTSTSGIKYRTHLRRGHIRRLPSGKTTWVTSCVINKEAEHALHKDYRLKAAA